MLFLSSPESDRLPEFFCFSFLGAFLHGQSVDPSTKDGNPCKILPEVWEEGPTREDEYEEEEHFSVLMERLGANNAFEE